MERIQRWVLSIFCLRKGEGDMKAFYKIAAILSALLFAFPTVAFAEEEQYIPAVAEAECVVVKNNAKEILIEELKIRETAPDAFSKGDILTFCVKNMNFEKVGRMENSVGSIQNGVSIPKEGELVITIKDAKDSEVETITLSYVVLSPKRGMLPVGTYQLQMILPNAENTKVSVLDDFIQVYNILDEKQEYRIEVKSGCAVMKVNDAEKQLRVPAYLSDSGYTMLPLREITTVFPWVKVIWEQERKEVTIIAGAKIANMTAGADSMLLNGETICLKNTAEVKDGCIFLSVRDICRICSIPNQDVHWDKTTGTVMIRTEL